MAMFLLIGFSAVSAIDATASKSTVENTNPVPCPSYQGGGDLGFIFAKVDGFATSCEKPTSFLEDGIFALFGTEIYFKEVTIRSLFRTKIYSDMTVWVIGVYHQTGNVHINTIFAAADTEK